jgi:class 3 adenylate cyclase
MGCIHCGAQIPAGIELCPVCRVPQQGPCSSCGHFNPIGAKFCSECGTRVLLSQSLLAGSGSRLNAERRQLTVMFCDLVGSTPLTLRLDPEDMLAAIGSFQFAVATTVERFGGYVARSFGDGVLVYFGWPQAAEANAESAVRAGLAVVEAVSRKTAKGETLRVRIGLASGVVVVGDIIGPDAVQEQAVVGAAPNLASRLQGLAEPDTIVISQETRTQIGDLFSCQDLGMIALRGFADKVHAWRVSSESAVQSRFEALHRSYGPIVGRDDEIKILLDQWHQTKKGKGSVVLIAGEAGIGKSRLVAALEEQLHGEPYTRLRYFCAPHRRDTALHPIISRFEHAIDPNRKATTSEKLSALRALVAETNPPQEDVALLAEMLSLPHNGLPARNVSPQRRKERTFEALNRQLQGLARKRPVLMVLEDAHWSDPTTLKLFDLTVDILQGLPVLFIMTFRPDFDPQWHGRSGVVFIKLGRLDRPQMIALVAQLEGRALLPRGLVDRIIVRSDGIPLFGEELTKAALENLSWHAPGSAAASGSLALPNTLESLLMARLDRLPIAKEVAHIAAVIGQEFSHGLLLALAQMPEATLLQGLDELIAAELIFRRGVPPDAIYMFKHAPLHDAAYETLLRSRRSALHARLVQVLLEQVPDLEETEPGLLGHHCAQAGQIEKAALYYRRAGELLAEQAAFVGDARTARARLDSGDR